MSIYLSIYLYLYLYISSAALTCGSGVLFFSQASDSRRISILVDSSPKQASASSITSA